MVLPSTAMAQHSLQAGEIRQCLNSCPDSRDASDLKECLQPPVMLRVPSVDSKLATNVWLRCDCATAVPEHDVMGFADGGSIDNLAVMPLLRRGVRCMIVFMASATPPDATWERFAEGESTRRGSDRTGSFSDDSCS